MEIILLEKIKKLGDIGFTLKSIAKVKHLKGKRKRLKKNKEKSLSKGFIRNYLLPMGKAILATEKNKIDFESKRLIIEAKNQTRIAEANEIAKQIDSITITIEKQATEDKKLYGSVTPIDISKALSTQSGYDIISTQINYPSKLREIGNYEVTVTLYHDITAKIKLNIVRNS